MKAKKKIADDSHIDLGAMTAMIRNKQQDRVDARWNQKTKGKIIEKKKRQGWALGNLV